MAFKKKSNFLLSAFLYKNPTIKRHKCAHTDTLAPQSGATKAAGEDRRGQAVRRGGAGWGRRELGQHNDSGVRTIALEATRRPPRGCPALRLPPPLFFGFRASRVPAAPAPPYRTPRPPAPQPAASLALGARPPIRGARRGRGGGRVHRSQHSGPRRPEAAPQRPRPVARDPHSPAAAESARLRRTDGSGAAPAQAAAFSPTRTPSARRSGRRR